MIPFWSFTQTKVLNGDFNTKGHQISKNIWKWKIVMLFDIDFSFLNKVALNNIVIGDVRKVESRLFLTSKGILAYFVFYSTILPILVIFKLIFGPILSFLFDYFWYTCTVRTLQ